MKYRFVFRGCALAWLSLLACGDNAAPSSPDPSTDAGVGADATIVPQPGSETDAGSDSATGKISFTSITPNKGSTAGGTEVTIIGSNFPVGGTVSVTIGGVPASQVIVKNATTITCKTGANLGKASPVDVVIKKIRTAR